MMRLAMIGTKVGKKVVVVIEKPGELGLLIKAARDLGVTPTIGIRVRLQTQGSGKWKYSSGHSAKFGLTTTEILETVEELRSAGLMSCVKLLHFHIGSQVTDIQAIKDAVKEGSRVYAKLQGVGLNIEYLDCGGGLGVDYDGTHSSVDSSVNYTLREYVRALVMTVQEVCRQEKVPEPHLVTESGRSLVAHHSLLAVNVFGFIEGGANPVEIPPSPDEHEIVRALRALSPALSPKNLIESYHEAVQRRDEAFSLFNLGYLRLEDKAKAETLFWSLCREIGQILSKAKDTPEDLIEMSKALRDQYLCNFSIFQSLPDSWAIGQLFPIMPIERLNEEPSRRAALVDITCDSDGKISQFACHRKAGGTLPLHPLRDDEPYYLGVFLMGAYQATMGDIHNLFGRVSEVHVFEDSTEPSGYYIEEVIQGQNVREVLESIQYSDFELVKRLKASIDTQVRSGTIKPREGVDLLDEYEAAMQKYTYIDYGNTPKSWSRRSSDASPNPNFVKI
jgi:arginine decarboxylase